MTEELVRRMLATAFNDMMSAEAEHMELTGNAQDLFCADFPDPKTWSYDARDEDGNVIVAINDSIFVVRVEKVA